jgi:hypothetical protein
MQTQGAIKHLARNRLFPLASKHGAFLHYNHPVFLAPRVGIEALSMAISEL